MRWQEERRRIKVKDLFKQWRQITSTVKNAGDLNSITRLTIENYITTNRKAPQMWGKFFTRTPQIWQFGEFAEAGNNDSDQLVGSINIIPCDVKPNVVQIRLRLPRNPTMVHAFLLLRSLANRSRPLRPTSSANCMMFSPVKL